MDLNLLIIDHQVISNEFKRLADLILNNTLLIINHIPHRICEIEFYYLDPFGHRHALQQLLGYWYFHAAGKTGYKGGTYKGMDITFTSTLPDTYGGILIRSIQLPSEKMIEGPSKIVDYVLVKGKFKSIADMMSNCGDHHGKLQVNDVTAPVYLRYDPTLTSEHIYSAPRVGLSLKIPSKEKYEYIMRNYRYFINPHNIKKMKNLIVLALLQQGHDQNMVQKITKTSLITIKRYQDHFIEGSHLQLDFDKPYLLNTIAAASKLYGYLNHNLLVG